MTFVLKTCLVGPWPVNSYLLICTQTHSSAIVDPGADPQAILELAEGTRVSQVLITHGHEDHVGAVGEICTATGAPVRMHPADAERFKLDYDLPFQDGEEILIGASILRVLNAPGHTPGMCCFDLGDRRVLVGDTLFTGGPGKTWSAEDFTLQMHTMRQLVFSWPDETVFYPGHGKPGRIGDERPAFEAFIRRGWPIGLYGDVTWTA